MIKNKYSEIASDVDNFEGEEEIRAIVVPQSDVEETQGRVEGDRTCDENWDDGIEEEV